MEEKAPMTMTLTMTMTVAMPVLPSPWRQRWRMH